MRIRPWVNRSISSDMAHAMKMGKIVPALINLFEMLPAWTAENAVRPESAQNATNRELLETQPLDPFSK